MDKLKNLPLLEAKDIACRIQSVSKTGKGFTLLIYKDARVDMRILDEMFGAYGWQRTHEVIDGQLFCNVDVWDDDKKCWVRKQDIGTESNTEAEKGRASDAFKRACFNLGIGRELFTAPFIFVNSLEGEIDQNNKATYKAKFSVADIKYNGNREITYLRIVDTKGNTRYEMGKAITQPTPKAQPPITPEQPQQPPRMPRTMPTQENINAFIAKGGSMYALSNKLCKPEFELTVEDLRNELIYLAMQQKQTETKKEEESNA
jgi:Uncharacterized protein conserved in bacteria